MLTALRLRSAAVLAAGLATLLLLPAGAIAEDRADGPGPEEMAALSAAAAVAGPALQTTNTAAVAAAPGLPIELLEAAGAYRLYMRQAGALSPEFANGASIAQALKLGAAYEPKQLTRGAVAFAAVAALQEPAFVEGLRAAAADPARRAALAAELVRSPHLAPRLAGGEAAAGRAVAALAGEGELVRAAGLRVKQAAYDVQRQSWAKGEVNARVERLADAKALSAQALSAPAAELAELQLAALGASRLSLPAGTPEPSARPVVARGLALAALAVLGQADPVSAQTLSEDADCGSCLRMSKLNLFQCLAVAKPWYEDVFCLGQHVLIDTGDCIQAAVNQPAPALARPVVARAPATPYQPSPPVTLTAVAALR